MLRKPLKLLKPLKPLKLTLERLNCISKERPAFLKAKTCSIITGSIEEAE